MRNKRSGGAGLGSDLPKGGWRLQLKLQLPCCYEKARRLAGLSNYLIFWWIVQGLNL